MVLGADLSTGSIHRRRRMPAFCVAPSDLADDAAAEADGHRMGARARLQLREEVPHMRLDRLLGQKQPDADLAVHEPLRDQLEHLDLAHRRLLLELAERALELDDLGAVAVSAPGR